MPIIELAVHPISVDLRLGLLRPKDDFSTMGIELNLLPISESGTGFQSLYNHKTHTEVTYDENWLGIPKEVMAMEIPGELVLDPVGTLMKYSDVLAGKYPLGNRDEALGSDEKSIGFRKLVKKKDKY